MRGLGVGGTVVLLIVLLAGLYEERWVLDVKKQELRFRFGLFFLARTIKLPFAEIEGIELERFYKGRSPGTLSPDPAEAKPGGIISQGLGLARIFQPKPYINLVLNLKDGLHNSNRLIVESVKEKQSDRLKHTGKAFADCLGLELRV